MQTHVQTARESPDLNMDFRSFDNGTVNSYTNRNLCKNIGLSILLHGIISLPGATSCDKKYYFYLSIPAIHWDYK